MQPEMADRLRRLQQRAQQLGRLADQLRVAAPAVQEGRDTSGCVSVVLGADRLPIEVRIREPWQEWLEPERLGPAVMEANTDSLQEALRFCSARLDESNWWRAQRDADSIRRAETAPALAPSRVVPTGRAGDDPELNERVLRFARSARVNAARPAPKPVEGTDDSGAVIVQIGPGGLIACRIDETWARHRDGGTVSARVSQAIRRAKAGLESPRPALAEAGVIIDDALAALLALTDVRTAHAGVR